MFARWRPLTLLFFLLALTLPASAARAQGSESEPPPPPAQSLNELEARLTAIMAEKKAAPLMASAARWSPGQNGSVTPGGPGSAGTPSPAVPAG